MKHITVRIAQKPQKRRLLIVVDYQNDFVSGALGFPGAEQYDKPIAEKIAAYRAAGDQVVFTYDTHTSDYLYTQEGENLPIPHCIRGEEGWRLYGETAKAQQCGDVCFAKPAFGSAGLMQYLQQHDYESIELVGLVSYICVISNAILAKTAQPETPVLVDAACTGGPDEQLHNAALDVMQTLQIQVLNR